MIRRAAHRGLALAPLGLILLTLACQSPGAGAASPAEPVRLDERTEQLIARRALEDGRALRMENRLDAAERVIRRGLARAPSDPLLERELAQVLDAAGRSEEAQAARARADRRDPPPAPLPDAPLEVAAGHTLVVLIPGTRDLRPEETGHWPEDALVTALAERVTTRIPDASLLRADPASVSEATHLLVDRKAARALTLRIDRADCRSSVKDGEIAVAEIRFAAAARGRAALPPARAKVVLEDPPALECARGALERGLERALASDAWQRAARDAGSVTLRPWEEEARRLFPGIQRRIGQALRQGESLLRAGRLGEALRIFEDATRLDPADPEIRSYVDDTQRSLALAREIAARSASDEDPDSLDPRLSPAQRAAAEVALAREQRRREDLLGALAVLDEDVRAPAPEALTTLRPVEIRNPEAFGPSLARRQARNPVEARAAYAPDGSVLARYYFVPGSSSPLLREEDTNGNGAPDRWIAYRGGARGEIYEDGQGRGHPDARLVFADGGEPLMRIELDLFGDDRPDRVFRYENGRLQREENDTDGDGRLDRFDQIGSDGQLDVREEDLDGDGEIDVKSVYRAGKLVRREIASPEYVPES